MPALLFLKFEKGFVLETYRDLGIAQVKNGLMGSLERAIKKGIIILNVVRNCKIGGRVIKEDYETE